MQNDCVVIIKKERDSGSKKTKIETIGEPKDVNDLGGESPIFTAVTKVDLENLNLLINHEYQRTFYTPSLVRQGDFLNLHTKCMDSKPNLNYDLLHLLHILVHGERIVFFIFDGVMYTYS